MIQYDANKEVIEGDYRGKAKGFPRPLTAWAAGVDRGSLMISILLHTASITKTSDKTPAC
jgi:hypothetical protein